ncbi:large neutral amino acids transporter small subunit 2-like isoform X1 [Anneissia japonica]|uniref:large neutral amino acids transporter small subunit 2-like isoform X1 n=1 Tax=Anneissia japonica TaxID=1529436 RepID=UPI00142557F4|nr:large neutral amino acids transporter small subunit 2-like isoform X1 [Anneissia japonica]
MARNEPRLHRIEPQLGLLNAISITICTIIGSGIFISPKGVYQNVGSVGISFFVWIICGITALFTDLCWVELALAMPKFGGEYLYLQKIYGNFPAFVFQWLSFLVLFPAGVAVVALTFSEYVLAPFLQNCNVPTACLNLISLIMITFCAYINAVSVRAAKAVVNFLMMAKFFALGVIIFAGAVFMLTNGDKVVSFDNSFSNIKWGNLGLAYYAASWSFSGGDSIMSATEEFVNPKRSFPRAIYISTTIVICLYLLVNFAYFAVLTPDEILLSNAVAVTFAEKTLGQFRWLIPVFVALSTTLMNSFLAQPRAYYATARDGMFPGIMALVSVKYRTPVGSIIVTCFVSVIYVFVNDIWTLLNYFGFVGACCDALALSTLFVMRWCRPDIHKPFMVPIIFPLIAIAISFGAVVLATVSSPIDALVGLALTLSVVPAYLIGVYPKTKVAVAGKISGNLTRFVQMLTVSSPEDKVDLQ